MAEILVDAIAPRSIDAPTGELKTVVRLTSQEVKALAAANIDLVPAPGAGLANVPMRVVYSLDRNAAFDDAAADGDLVLAYKTTQTALITSEADAFIDAAADVMHTNTHAAEDDGVVECLHCGDRLRSDQAVGLTDCLWIKLDRAMTNAIAARDDRRRQ
ncbi:hypothetical protein LCGC14_2811030 [marine sediment metagenome]|uniref:Uncharacterized protein n=1 Tax=marine sediment metagenome TaxID=412755 RepID=A0A0F8Z6N3_9ZZZZ